MIPELLHCFGDEASKWFSGSGLLFYKDVKWNPDKGMASSAKERDSEEMVKEDLWDLKSKWEQINKSKASTRPDEAALDAPTTSLAAMPATGITGDAPTTGFTAKMEGLPSDKSIASFQNVYNRPIIEDDIKEADALAKAQADKPVDLTRTQFKSSTEQLERDRQKAQEGPLSTGMSMSTAVKTTPRTRLKLKEAQEEIHRPIPFNPLNPLPK
jgi:hypothetical protein